MGNRRKVGGYVALAWVVYPVQTGMPEKAKLCISRAVLCRSFLYLCFVVMLRPEQKIVMFEL